MQMSTLDSYQHSNNTTILCIWLGVREMQAVCMKAVTENEWKRNGTYCNWCSMFH